ncbi:hypothetical protein K0M31_001379 [Melipona bicolor]|uniref:Uncharacterized protein n=1 Tax=Melipona bicolor TaxID=60889 RepID=A0AA40GFC6_9HYME|nr:hypothetical protein K0M31_001379 [Melipona bicolor]
MSATVFFTHFTVVTVQECGLFGSAGHQVEVNRWCCSVPSYIGFTSLPQLEECLLLRKLPSATFACNDSFRLRKVPWVR